MQKKKRFNASKAISGVQYNQVSTNADAEMFFSFFKILKRLLQLIEKTDIRYYRVPQLPLVFLNLDIFGNM